MPFLPLLVMTLHAKMHQRMHVAAVECWPTLTIPQAMFRVGMYIEVHQRILFLSRWLHIKMH